MRHAAIWRQLGRGGIFVRNTCADTLQRSFRVGEILRRPITEASAWRSSEVATDDSWIYRFSPAELAELDAAVETVKARGLTAFVFGKEDFQLPTLAARIDEFREAIENGRGFVILPGLQKGRT